VSLGIFLPATPPSYNLMPMEERARAPSMAATNSTASSSYPEEMLMGPPSQEGTMGLQWQQPHCYPPNAYYDYKPNPVYSQIDMVDSSVRMLLSQKSGLVSPSSALSPSSSTLSSPAYRNLAPPVQLLSHF
jgi:hypothetical protein